MKKPVRTTWKKRRSASKLSEDRLFDDDPILGAYRAHYPSHRLRLLLIGGFAYAVPVIIITLLTLRAEGVLVNIVVPLIYAALALGVFWYMAHYWNKEVILYTRGFIFREGSREVRLLYARMMRVRVQAERVRLFGVWRYDRYRYEFTSQDDEHIVLTNLYRDIARLGERLEIGMAEARLPLLRQQLARAERIVFSPDFALSGQGIECGETLIPWQAYQTVKIAQGALSLQYATETGTASAQVALETLDNLRLLLALLKERTPTP